MRERNFAARPRAPAAQCVPHFYALCDHAHPRGALHRLDFPPGARREQAEKSLLPDWCRRSAPHEHDFLHGLFFYQTEPIQALASALHATNPLAFIVLLVGLQGVIEVVVSGIVSTLIVKVLSRLLAAQQEIR